MGQNKESSHQSFIKNNALRFTCEGCRQIDGWWISCRQGTAILLVGQKDLNVIVLLFTEATDVNIWADFPNHRVSCQKTSNSVKLEWKAVRYTNSNIIFYVSSWNCFHLPSALFDVIFELLLLEISSFFLSPLTPLRPPWSQTSSI